jgi:hypothetical protein
VRRAGTWRGAGDGRPEDADAVIAVFDFLSHDAMHLPFNEGYLLTLRAAFPDRRIRFVATPGHAKALAPRFADDPMIEFRGAAPYVVPFGVSRHNPIGGMFAARACLAAMREAVAGEAVAFAAVLGADAHIHSILRRRWAEVSAAPLHVILHNQIAEAVKWRSRNPFIRRFDLIMRLRHPLPARMRLVALELGIAESVERLAPALAGSIDTLEHPILESEWVAARPAGAGAGPLRIGFLGHASADKGFVDFAAWARRAAGPERSFHAIGIAAPEVLSLDLSGLATKPSPRSVPRDAYVAGMAACDVVCLGLSPIYDYVASGSVMDAIAALKPLYCVRNNSLTRLEQAYGPFGVLAANPAELGEAICRLTRESLAPHVGAWTESLSRMRAARRPAALAPGYAAAIAAIGGDARTRHGRQSEDAGA